MKQSTISLPSALLVLSLAGACLCTRLALPAGKLASSGLNSEYLSVLRSGELRKLREFLDRGASPHARDARGTTALMHAAVYSDVTALRLLLERGALVNVTNSAGATPLMRAAGDAKKVRLLLEHGADVNVASSLGNTALMLAARPADSHRAVALLIEHGASVNATNQFGATALMAAAAGGDEESVRLLLRHGANPNAQAAANPGGFILGGGRSPLMWAAYHGDLTIMKLLMDAGADVNSEGALGTPLAQAAWADRTAAAQLLMGRGARVNQASQKDGYTPLHWAASSESLDPSLVKLLLSHGADPNAAGGENIDAFMSKLQTPLMLAQHRGKSPILTALEAAGATNAESTGASATSAAPERRLLDQLDPAVLRSAIRRALEPLQFSSIESKQAFVRHGSHQDCTSCHQQYLPMAAIGLAKKRQVPVNGELEDELIRIVRAGELKNPEADWQPLFHPDPAHTKGYTLFAYAAEDLSADESTDSWVHHLSSIQGRDGRWFNNLPRPPLQTGDIGATALAIHALQRYPLPGRRAEFAAQVDRARAWLWAAQPDNTEGRVYQILGLAWAGVPPAKLGALAKALAAEQRPDGGWAQLPGTASDAYATGQALYALRVGAGFDHTISTIERGCRFLLQTQLDDGTWHVRRRAFPFQPTMKSGFPHGRDSWISAAGSSWAVLALSLPPADDLRDRAEGTLQVGAR
ncbi:MAG TPA: ankyrin repeat domain-containing protein [Verrucomicrobiae bacterium]|nr:ankyrin repeat domain-containing protein [Verrucomicrobiae bacterium]